MSDEQPIRDPSHESDIENSAFESDSGLGPARSTPRKGDENSQPDASTGRSVLKILDRTIDVPRVILQDTDLQHPEIDRTEPIQNPSSLEIPSRDPDSRYSLQGEIARGGMGAIIKGRDVDLGRDLAIKVLLDEHKAKPEVIQRFIEEAQIGGQLQHPGIAPVYELGQFSDQRPYFSMKLVKGTTLSKLLAKRDDASEDRARFLGIFEQVCQAVGYAHARGVIHRDLKPANIMVGAFGEVQVMDWGLAKVLPNGGIEDEKAAHSKHKQQTVLRTLRSSGSDLAGLDGLGSGTGSGSGSADTQMGSVMGTPAYMSPEQAQGEIDLVDQRSDVFGLGAILCEILTGLPPYVDDNPNVVFRMASRGKLDDAVARLDQCGAGDELIELAKRCLSVESVDRPRDASALTERVTEYLESVETKLRQSEIKQARTRTALWSGAVVMLALGLGVVGTGWQWSQTELARAEALSSAQRAEQARAEAIASARQATDEKEKAIAAREAAQAGIDLVASVFEELDPEEVLNQDRPLQELIVDNLDGAIAELNSGAIGDPLAVADLQLKLGRSLLALDEAAKAVPLLERARDAYQEFLGPTDQKTLASMHHLSLAYEADARLPGEEVLGLRQQTYDARRDQFGEDAPDTLESLVALSDAHSLVGDYTKATELAEQAAEGLERELGSTNPTNLDAKLRLVEAYAYDGQWDKMLDRSEALYELCRTKFGDEHLRTLKAEAASVWARTKAIDNGKGSEQYAECIAKLETILGSDHSWVLSCMQDLSLMYSDSQQWERAIQVAEDVLKRRQAKLEPNHPLVLESLAYLASAYQRRRRTAKALPLAEQVYDVAKTVFGPDHPDTITCKSNYAVQLGEAGKHYDSLPLGREVFRELRARLGPEHPETLRTMANLACTLRSLERYAEAIELGTAGLNLCEKKLGIGHSQTWYFAQELCLAFRKSGEANRAIRLADQCYQKCMAELGDDSSITLRYGGTFAHNLNEFGQHGKATPLLENLFQLAANRYQRRRYGTALIKNYGNIGETEKAEGVAAELTKEIDTNQQPGSMSHVEERNGVQEALLQVYAQNNEINKVKSKSNAYVAEMRNVTEAVSLELASALANTVMPVLKAEAFSEAAQMLRECEEIRAKSPEIDPFRLALTRLKLGWALLGTGQFDEANKYLAAGYTKLGDDAIEEAAFGNEVRRNVGRNGIEEALTAIIDLYRQKDRPEQADKLQAELNRRLKAWGRDATTASN